MRIERNNMGNLPNIANPAQILTLLFWICVVLGIVELGGVVKTGDFGNVRNGAGLLILAIVVFFIVSIVKSWGWI